MAEIDDIGLNQPAKRKGGLAGAKTRVAALSQEKREEIAREADATRWTAKRVRS